MNLINSRIIIFLKRMDKSEFYDFGKYVHSDYHNKRQQVIVLFDYFKKYYPVFEHPKFNKEEAFKKLFPKQPIVIKKINNAMYYMGELLNEYLILQELKYSKRTQQYLMTTALERKTLDQYLYKHLDNWKAELDSIPLKIPETYFDLQHIHKRRFFYTNTQKLDLKETSFDDMLQYADEYFVIEKLRNVFYTSIRSNVLSKKVNINLVEIAHEYLEENPLGNPVVEIYQKMILLMRKPKHELFLKTKKLIDNNIDLLPTQEEKIDWITFLSNYASKEKSKGNSQYDKIFFDITLNGIDKGLFHEKDILDSTAYANVLISGVSNKKAKWLEDFIEKRLPELAVQNQVNYKILSEICLEYAKDNLEDTILLINDLEIEHYGLNLVTRTIRICSLLQLEITKGTYYDVLINTCDAHEKYVRRHQEIPQRIVISNINFIKLVKEFIHIKRADINKVEWTDKVKNTTTVCKEWLVNIIERL